MNLFIINYRISLRSPNWRAVEVQREARVLAPMIMGRTTLLVHMTFLLGPMESMSMARRMILTINVIMSLKLKIRGERALSVLQTMYSQVLAVFLKEKDLQIRMHFETLSMQFLVLMQSTFAFQIYPERPINHRVQFLNRPKI